jgi:hypothetical protein
MVFFLKKSYYFSPKYPKSKNLHHCCITLSLQTIEMKIIKLSLDKLSAGVSLLCLVHCVVLPIFLSTFTLAGIELVENMTLEVLMLLAGIIAGSIAIWKGVRKHGLWQVVVLFIIGMFFMIIGNLPELHMAEVALKIFGAVLVINAHIINYRNSRCRPAIK